ncbi:MAG TPA: hypothetical protein ENO21_02325, partial [Firmicutes bacterium]|nr:hypothetical protein [Bacillota bacterium]
MNNPAFARLIAAVLLAGMLLAGASCGGGDDTTTPELGGTIGVGSDVVPPLNISGPTQYEGKPGEILPDDIIGGAPPLVPTFEPAGAFGANIFAVPLDSNGTGKVVASNFSPGQRVAFIMLNTNPAYLDANSASGAFPVLPESSYSLTADLVDKGISSMASAEEIEAATVAELGPNYYNGLLPAVSTESPFAIYEREALARGEQPFTAQPVAKTTSAIQKGEVRTFINVPPRISPPVINPGEENPERDTSVLRWPRIYNSQDGRLVSIGAHCLVFLSTEINNGFPDSVQFTEARLNRLAREFDTKIFPIATSSFGPVLDYDEFGVWRNLDRSVRLDGDDFGANGELLADLPGTVDDALEQEQKIIIFLTNGDAGGFFTWFQPDGEIWQELLEDGFSADQIDMMVNAGSTIYIGGDNFPANDDAWEAAYSVMAHEFQHKLYHDHNLPRRNTGYMWFNEGLSMLSIHLCGYTVNSGKIIDWAIDGQLTDYLTNCNAAAVPMDANPYFSNQAQYGSGFLFFLYLYEHYDPGVGKRIYNAAASGVTDYISLVEFGAQTTVFDPGPDEVMGTDDDEISKFNDTFKNLYT